MTRVVTGDLMASAPRICAQCRQPFKSTARPGTLLRPQCPACFKAAEIAWQARKAAR